MKRRTRVGIDVSARSLDLALERGKAPPQNLVFENTAEGHRKLIKRLTRGGAGARVCLEATGVYHLNLCLALHAANGIEVMVVNLRAAVAPLDSSNALFVEEREVLRVGKTVRPGTAGRLG